ncbi:MAG: T9SS type A sorting domain-containing protein [Saprospiraceae bacterium]
MKIRILLNVFIGVTFCFFSVTAQDTLNVAPFTDEGELNLVPAIFGDTTETGERANLNRVYRLQRGGIYLMDQTIFADFPIHLVAGGDDSQRPPMLVRGKYPTGDPIKTFFTFTGDELSHSFENIFFTGVDEDRAYLSQWNRGLKVAGDNINLSLSNCIMNAWSGLFLEITGDNTSLFVRDSKWRNGVGSQAPPWGAQQNVVFSTHIDTIIFTNNTVFNTGGFWLFQEDGIADYVKVEHNTIFTGLIDQIRMRDFVNTHFRSNLLYGTHAYGQTQSEQEASWFDKDGEVISMFSIDTSGIDLLASNGLVESDKKIKVSHNAYFSPQALKDWWATIDGINTPVFMHERTKAMFNNDNDWPGLEAFQNLEMDPQFTDTDMETWVVDEVIKYCDNTRNGAALTDRNYDVQTGNIDPLLINWPLPESLVYTNATLLSGGHDGLPVGDLNWYPELRGDYEENPTATNDLPKQNTVNVINSISPNPAKDIISIEVTFDNNSQANLNILDINGALVKSIPTETYNVGYNIINIDVNDIGTGTYILQVKTKNNISNRRFVKTK